MRPKKLVLVYSTKRAEVEEWRFKLETKGYAVLGATSLQAAREYEIQFAPNVAGVLSFVPGNLGIGLLQDSGLVPVLLANCAEEQALHTSADLFVVAGPGFASRVLEAVKTMVAKKRGPGLNGFNAAHLRDLKAAALGAIERKVAA